MIKKKIHYILLMLLIPFLAFAQDSSPEFYLSTDKSFAKEETPYINLEGSGYNEYIFRIYEVKDPENFLQKKVKERLVKEDNENPTFADPIKIFKKTVEYFRNDFRTIARKEFNSKTRSSISKGLAVDYSPVEEENFAHRPILQEHKLLLTFTVPKDTKSWWMYKRVPIPLKDNGVFLIETISNSHIAYTLVFKSDIHFVTKLAENETLVYVARKDNGVPSEKADVKIWDESFEKISSGKTNSSGIFHYKGKSKNKSFILVKHDNQFAVSDPNYYSSSFYSEGGIKVYLYTDRPVYRPGDTVYFKGIVRNFNKEAYFPKPGKGTIDVFTYKGDLIEKELPVQINEETGTFNGEFKSPTGESVYLGVYNLVLNLDDKTYSTEFSIDAYKKPSFLVKIKSEKPSYISGEKVRFEISAKYYHGKPLSGLEVEYQIFRKAKYDYSPIGNLNWDGTDSYLTSKEGASRREIVKSDRGALDRDGNLNISFKPENITEDYSYSVVASVKDSNTTLSGSTSFSVNRSSIFIRIKKENQIYEPNSLVSVNTEIIPYDRTLSKSDFKKEVSGKNIQLTVYKRKFQNISGEAERVKVDSYTSSTNEEGKAAFQFKIPEKGHYVVKLETKDSHGSETFAETTFWSSSKSDSIEIPIKDITLTSGKDIYSLGDTAEILILSPVADANVLVTLESNRIIKYESIPMKGNSLKYSVKISPDLSPNFTLSAVLFANRETYSGQLKIVAPPENKILNVKVKSDREIYNPGDTVQLEINTSNLKQKGIKSEVSISVVDEAIYQIQEDKNPPLITYFYHPRRNDVNTVYSSSYRYFGYSESKRMNLALGKKSNLPLAALKEDDNRSREKFKDTAFWNATVMTDVEGKAKLNFVLPDNLTSWRINVVALTGDSKFGQTTNNFISRKPISLQANTPSYLLKGEKHNISATITNYSIGKEDIIVGLEITNGKIEGESSKKISLKPNENALVSFSIIGDENPSNKEVILKFTAKGNYQDKSEHRIPMKFFGVKKIETYSLKINSKFQRAISNFILPENGVEEKLLIRLNPGNAEALKSSLPFLIDYPYGCVEQTMSRFVPILAAENANILSSELKNELPKMASAGLINLKNLLGPNGGFRWFSNESPEDVLMSAYVYRALAISNKLNQPPDESIFNNSRSYLYKALESTSDLFLKAYIVFALTEGGTVENSIIDSLSKTTDKQGVYGKSLIGLILHSNSNLDKAKEVYKKAILESGLTTGKILEEGNFIEKDGVETLSALLLLSVRLGEESNSELITEELLNRRNGVAWKNSRDTGMAVLAISEKLKTYSEKLTPIKFTIRINGKDFKKLTSTPDEVISGNANWNFSIPNIVKGDNSIELIRESGDTIYAGVTLEYLDKSKYFEPLEKGIVIGRQYFSVTPEEKNGKTTLITKKSNSFKVGELVMVALEIERKGKDDSYFMIEDPLLPSFSLVRKDTNYYTGELAAEYESRQFYDDRAKFFLRGPTQKATIRYFLRADMAGTFNVAPSAVSLMYYPEIRGNSGSQSLTVE